MWSGRAAKHLKKPDRSLRVELLELGSGAHDAFLSKGSDERSRLLKEVVLNSSWKEGRLAVQLHQPFDLILKEVTKAR